MSVLMFDFGILRLASLVMACSCMAPLTPAVMVMRGFVSQPLFRVLLTSGSYLSCLCARACSGNLSWQYVNSMNCTVYAGVGINGVVNVVGSPSTHSISGFSLARHWQGGCGHVHCMSQSEMVFSWCMLCWLPAFASM